MSTPSHYQVEDFWRNGFAFCRGVFATEEVDQFAGRARILQPQQDLLSDDVLVGLLCHPKVLEVARTLLGPDLVYFGDSNVLNGPTDAGFHKDNADKDDPQAPDWQGRYPIVRFGVYAQDHTTLPDGLDLRLGSHEKCNVVEGQHVFADLAKGDLAVWNLRTSHSGGSLMLRNGRPLDPAAPLAKLLRRVPLGLLRTPAKDRVGIFWTFGAPGSHLDRYIAYLKTRRYAVERWQHKGVSAEARDRLAVHGVALRDVAAELSPDALNDANERHVALAY